MTFNASIVTFNHKIEDIKELIESVIQSKFCNVLYIIDNSNINDLEEDVKALKNVIYIFSGSNKGFGSAHNVALKLTLEQSIRYHFVINPDIRFEIGTIEKIIEFMVQHPEIGLLMPKVLYPNGNIQYLPKLLPSPIDLLIRRFGILRNVFLSRLKKYELSEFLDSGSYNVPIISGCFSCFHVDVLKESGLYDERFFMYFEDFDLSRRINERYKTIYYSDVYVYHEYERGAQKSSVLFRIFLQPAVKYFNKWGWFFDSKRKKINKKCLEQFNI